MFEGTLITLLKANVTLQSLLSTYESSPAIFSSSAPQAAEEPYIVLDITEIPTQNLPVSAFDTSIDVYNRSESTATVRAIVRELINILDTQEIKTDTNYSTIRFYTPDVRDITEKDTDIVHYLCRFPARAGRKSWIDQL